MSDFPANNQPTPDVTDPAKPCDNCSQPFGKLESPILWNFKHQVCATCHQKLTYCADYRSRPTTETKMSSIFVVAGTICWLIVYMGISDNQYYRESSMLFLLFQLGSVALLLGLGAKAITIGIRESKPPKD